MGESRGTYRDRFEGTGRERADHYNALSARRVGQDWTGPEAERQAPAGLRAYSMLNFMAGGLVRHEAFWASPSEEDGDEDEEEEEDTKQPSVGREEDQLLCVVPAACGAGRRRRPACSISVCLVQGEGRREKEARVQRDSKGHGPEAFGNGASRSASTADVDLDVRC